MTPVTATFARGSVCVGLSAPSAAPPAAMVTEIGRVGRLAEAVGFASV